jgi:hypothetical protein
MDVLVLNLMNEPAWIDVFLNQPSVPTEYGMVQKCPILGNTSKREPTRASRGENWLVKREA